MCPLSWIYIHSLAQKNIWHNNICIQEIAQSQMFKMLLSLFFLGWGRVMQRFFEKFETFTLIDCWTLFTLSSPGWAEISWLNWTHSISGLSGCPAAPRTMFKLARRGLLSYVLVNLTEAGCTSGSEWAKCAKCAKLCKMWKVVQNVQTFSICAKVCKIRKMCKVVQNVQNVHNVQNCAKCANC